MIARITGSVATKGDGWAIVDVGGIGLRLLMPTGAVAALPAEGDDVIIHTHLHVREDELSLFGFESEPEKSAFEALITVSGVGPKVALATLSTLSPDALADAVATEDVAVVSSVPGIGKKTAQRIILELADKLVASGAVPSPQAGAATGSAGGAEAREALLSMGFSAAEVSVALRGVSGSDAGEIVRHALVRLGGGV